ncbi:MAG: ROK family protein [Hyphomicrobiaceae bacterium]|nr:ROK family protein [Hyphomicrobiaceae bacterium]
MRVDGDEGIRIGIDLGGTKIAGLALLPGGRTLPEVRMPTPREDYGATLDAIQQIVARLEAGAGARGTVGVGMPGSISPATGLVQNANSTWLNGRPFDRDLANRLQRPVRLANDANCFALSEATDGAAAGARSVFGVILGTGCGGGLVIGGRLVDGPRGIAGEWGHNPLPWATPDECPGPRCWCGRPGCIEAWVCGPALESDYARAAGERLASPEIGSRAAAGESAARETLARHASRLARSLAHVVNMLDPEVIVLGGGLSQMQHLYLVLPELMAPHVFSDSPGFDIRPPVWGDASGARGAARLSAAPVESGPAPVGSTS